MSPDGIVRWQGNPLGLREDVVASIIRASRELHKTDGPMRWMTEQEPDTGE
jgi:hypothetical protein